MSRAKGERRLLKYNKAIFLILSSLQKARVVNMMLDKHKQGLGDVKTEYSEQ